MEIHYLNCATMYPRGAGLFVPCLDRSPALCMLIETSDRLVLVDTGFGTRDMADTSRLGHGDRLLNTQPDPDQSAIRQIGKMGFAPADVRHIICTHLDRDHAGGLSDFPEAKVHVLAAEREAALHPKALSEKERYRQCHFAHGPRWVTHEALSDEKWFGSEYRNLFGKPLD
jgi:glyoxylase-like metal-dependent hydrolase (beta-lactamase superfamily II)